MVQLDTPRALVDDRLEELDDQDELDDDRRGRRPGTARSERRTWPRARDRLEDVVELVAAVAIVMFGPIALDDGRNRKTRARPRSRPRDGY